MSIGLSPMLKPLVKPSLNLPWHSQNHPQIKFYNFMNNLLNCKTHTLLRSIFMMLRRLSMSMHSTLLQLMKMNTSYPLLTRYLVNMTGSLPRSFPDTQNSPPQGSSTEFSIENPAKLPFNLDIINSTDKIS